MDTFNTYERNGLKITIDQDMDPESPREWDNLGTMFCSHRRYTLGDYQFDADDFDGWDAVKKHLEEDEGAVVILPLSLYDHSGISMSVGEAHGWDSGQVGFIYMTREKIEKEFPDDYATDIEATHEKVEKYLEGEVETYNQYLQGDIYGFTITNPKEDDEEVDALWGLYGQENAIKEANDVADYYKHPNQAKYAKKASQIHG